MTITYPNGIALQAVLVSRSNDELRAALAGDEDMRVFYRADGGWSTETGERVEIEFAWQQEKAARTPSESECICPKELASRLISILLTGSEGGELIEDMLLACAHPGEARLQPDQQWVH